MRSGEASWHSVRLRTRRRSGRLLQCETFFLIGEADVCLKCELLLRATRKSNASPIGLPMTLSTTLASKLKALMPERGLDQAELARAQRNQGEQHQPLPGWPEHAAPGPSREARRSAGRRGPRICWPRSPPRSPRRPAISVPDPDFDDLGHGPASGRSDCCPGELATQIVALLLQVPPQACRAGRRRVGNGQGASQARYGARKAPAAAQRDARRHPAASAPAGTRARTAGSPARRSAAASRERRTRP